MLVHATLSARAHAERPETHVVAWSTHIYTTRIYSYMLLLYSSGTHIYHSIADTYITAPIIRLYATLFASALAEGPSARAQRGPIEDS